MTKNARLAAVWALGVALVLVSGCTFDFDGAERYFTCEAQGDCPEDMRCQAGFCITAEAPSDDLTTLVVDRDALGNVIDTSPFDDVGDTAAPVDADALPECSLGERRCIPDRPFAFIRCTESGEEEVPCPEGKSCDGGECAKQICAPATTTCNDANEVVTCDLAGLSQVTTRCHSATLCVNGECMPEQDCAPGAAFCIGSTLRRCIGEPGTWLEFDCGAAGCEGNSCGPIAGQCPMEEDGPFCLPGSPAYVFRCTLEGKPTYDHPCAPWERCMEGACHAAACLPDAPFACVGPSAPATCTPDGTWSIGGTCDKSRCVVHADGPLCSPAPCGPSTQGFCQGPNVVTCPQGPKPPGLTPCDFEEGICLPKSGGVSAACSFGLAFVTRHEGSDRISVLSDVSNDSSRRTVFEGTKLEGGLALWRQHGAVLFATAMEPGGAVNIHGIGLNAGDPMFPLTQVAEGMASRFAISEDGFELAYRVMTPNGSAALMRRATIGGEAVPYVYDGGTVLRTRFGPGGSLWFSSLGKEGSKSGGASPAADTIFLHRAEPLSSTVGEPLALPPGFTGDFDVGPTSSYLVYVVATAEGPALFLNRTPPLGTTELLAQLPGLAEPRMDALAEWVYFSASPTVDLDIHRVKIPPPNTAAAAPELVIDEPGDDIAPLPLP